MVFFCRRRTVSTKVGFKESFSWAVEDAITGLVQKTLVLYSAFCTLASLFCYSWLCLWVQMSEPAWRGVGVTMRCPWFYKFFKPFLWDLPKGLMVLFHSFSLFITTWQLMFSLSLWSELPLLLKWPFYPQLSEQPSTPSPHQARGQVKISIPLLFEISNYYSS